MTAQTAVRVTTLLLAAALVACPTEGDKSWLSFKNKDGPCDNTGHDGFMTIGTREFVLHVPTSYDAANPVPLVLNFHGFGGCASDYSTLIGDFYDLHAVADAEGFLVAYPQGVSRAKGSAEWDPGDNGSEDIDANDPHFVEQLIAEISGDYNVDSSRVYAVGYSNGGMMAYGLACSRSRLIAAVGIMSGTMLADECDVDGYTSVMHFHGIADEVLPYEGSEDFQSVADVVAFWSSHNGIPVSSLVTTELNDGDVVKDEHSGGNDATAVVLYTVHREHGKRGGHVWFSEEIGGTSPNQILWDFLSGHAR